MDLSVGCAYKWGLSRYKGNGIPLAILSWPWCSVLISAAINISYKMDTSSDPSLSGQERKTASSAKENAREMMEAPLRNTKAGFRQA